jgi:hypothetical protein
MRRVVTGHAPNDEATIASDTYVDAITSPILPGMEFFTLWGADKAPEFPDDGSPRPSLTYFPPLGGFRFGVVTLPPGSAEPPKVRDAQAAEAELELKLPGLMSHMEKAHPGFHTIDTIDFEYVISGDVWLELDGGREVHLHAGDTVVQNGTRHAWRNKSSHPCSWVVCLIGAHRRQPG